MWMLRLAVPAAIYALCLWTATAAGNSQNCKVTSKNPYCQFYFPGVDGYTNPTSIALLGQTNSDEVDITVTATLNPAVNLPSGLILNPSYPVKYETSRTGGTVSLGASGLLGLVTAVKDFPFKTTGLKVLRSVDGGNSWSQITYLKCANIPMMPSEILKPASLITYLGGFEQALKALKDDSLVKSIEGILSVAQWIVYFVEPTNAKNLFAQLGDQGLTQWVDFGTKMKAVIDLSAAMGQAFITNLDKTLSDLDKAQLNDNSFATLGNIRTQLDVKMNFVKANEKYTSTLEKVANEFYTYLVNIPYGGSAVYIPWDPNTPSTYVLAIPNGGGVITTTGTTANTQVTLPEGPTGLPVGYITFAENVPVGAKNLITKYISNIASIGALPKEYSAVNFFNNLPVSFDIDPGFTVTKLTTFCYKLGLVPSIPTGSVFTVMHYVNGAWEKIAATYDPVANTVCASLSSFSPLVVVLGPPSSSSSAEICSPTGSSCSSSGVCCSAGQCVGGKCFSSSATVYPQLSAGSSTPVTFPQGSIAPLGQVVSGGVTVVTPISSPPPAGIFTLGNPPNFYDISTTAVCSGTWRICLNYSPNGFPNQWPRLFHYQGGAWVDVTTTRNVMSYVACGDVSTLSPFALGVTAATPTVFSTITVTKFSLKDLPATPQVNKNQWRFQGTIDLGVTSLSAVGNAGVAVAFDAKAPAAAFDPALDSVVFTATQCKLATGGNNLICKRSGVGTVLLKRSSSTVSTIFKIQASFTQRPLVRSPVTADFPLQVGVLVPVAGAPVFFLGNTRTCRVKGVSGGGKQIVWCP